MQNKLHALLIAVAITGSGIAYTLYTTRGKEGEIYGLSDATVSETAIADNQSIRFPETKTSFDSLLVNIGKSIGLTIVEIMDASFPWQAETNTYEVLGKKIKLEDATLENTQKALEILENEAFTASEINTYIKDNKENFGFLSNDDVCLVRISEVEKEEDTLVTKLEIMCGAIDYTRSIN